MILSKMNVSKRLVYPLSSSILRRSALSTSTIIKSGESGEGFFSSLFGIQKEIEHQSSSHSNQLSGHNDLLELQTHNVKPDRVHQYMEAHNRMCQFFQANETEGVQLNCKCVGNFNVFVGEQDQFIHIWKFRDGYSTLDDAKKKMEGISEYKALKKDLLSHLHKRDNQYLLQFSFWPKVTPREKSHIYELRSYYLKPGTMVEWGNYWARAIRMRDYANQEAFVGMFSQVGELYQVNHIWCYDSLSDRQKARDGVWSKQQMQWSDIVTNTMPLIRHMDSRLMVPTEYSPTQ